MFQSSVTAQNMTRAFLIIGGVILTIAGSAISSLVTNSTLANALQILFSAVPNTALAQCIQKLTIMGSICSQIEGATGGQPCPNNNPWDMKDGVGLPLISMVLYSILYSLIVVYIEKRRLQPPKYTPNRMLPDPYEDVDVKEEREKTGAIAALKQSDVLPVVHVTRLRKVYPAAKNGLTPEKVAIHDLSLSIERGTCFGLLGPNGAGKTTAMSILTGTAWATNGTASVASSDIHNDIYQIYQKLGFCPQFHGLFPSMTVDEHLTFYGELKGMAVNNINQFINVLTSNLDMKEHRDKLSKHLSGGNKRKLSMAISLMGAPDVLILDEPSAGIDPSARQNMVNILKSERKDRCIILTTHLMEECEALCNRIGIMVNGKLKAIGSLQHLKSRHGNFWQIDVNIDDNAPKTSIHELEKLMKSLDSKSFVLESHLNSSVWNVPNNNGIKLADCFRLFENNKEKLHILDYSVTQCSLEQIFIKFAREQIAEGSNNSDAATAFEQEVSESKM